MFAGPLKVVGATRIFARHSAPGRQVVIYRMQFAAADDVAMILPIPVVPGTADGAVEFHDLSDYDDLFRDLDTLFPAPEASRSRGPAAPSRRAQLAVVQVGAFDASFVPTLDDFDRLDPRFRLDASVWEALPQYADYGFVVFKLRGGDIAHEAHPMAFTFPTRWSEQLYFPTVHVHDGTVHEFADFDHALFAQVGAACRPLTEVVIDESRPAGLLQRLLRRPAPVGPRTVTWWQSEVPTGRAVDPERSLGLVDLDAPVYRLQLEGHLRNDDVRAVLKRAAAAPTGAR